MKTYFQTDTTQKLRNAKLKAQHPQNVKELPKYKNCTKKNVQLLFAHIRKLSQEILT